MTIDRLKLLHGPYAAPPVKRGDTLTCEARGRDVKVGGMSDGLIPWPRALKTGRPSLILCGDLVRAVLTESEIAVAHWWGVSIVVVWQWRKALGVGRMTEGTDWLYRDYKPQKLTDEVVETAREHARSPEARAKMSATRKGRPVSPGTRAALLAGAKLPMSDKAKLLLADRNTRNRKGKVVNPAHRPWTPEEDALVGTAPDSEIAAKISRSKIAVGCRRRMLGLAAAKRGHTPRSE